MERSEVRDSARRPSRAGVGLLALGTLIPVVPIVIGIFLVAGSVTHAAPGTVLRPLAPLTAPVRPVADRPAGATVAVLTHATELRAAPGGPVIAPQPLRTTFNSPTVLLVRRMVGTWLGVDSPLAGNGRLGWIPRSTVTLTSVDWKLEVSLSRRQVTVLHAGHVLERYTIAIGRPTAPTPTGDYAVTDRLETGDPSGPYGCCILALSALAPHAIQGWNGGNRIAIHSTPETSSIGLPVSHGCMRLTLPEGRWLIDHIPLGTPTIIRSD